MSAVSNPFSYHSSGPVAIPLVLGASGVHQNKQVFNSPIAMAFKEGFGEAATEAATEAAQRSAKIAAREAAQRGLKQAGKEGLGKAGRRQLTESITKQLVKAGRGELTEDMAANIAKRQVRNAWLQRSFTNGAKYFGKLGLKYGAIAGVGWMLFRFGSGALGAVGTLMGDAGADMVTGAAEWMGDNPGLTAGIVGIGIFLVGAAILGAIAPAAASKVAKDKVMGKDDEESEEPEDTSDESGE